jgi:ubiquinone/menaquinone biosynthesis C-methylase UbiE
MDSSSKKNALSHFQRWSSTYERSWLQPRLFEPTRQAVLGMIEHHLPTQPNTVLDVGCGTGQLLRLIHERWPDADLMGIDPTPGMVERAQQLTPSATFDVSFAEALPVPDASVGIAVSTFAFHHWSKQAAGLREVVRVLQPEGYFFLADVMLPVWLSRFLPWSHFRSPAQVQILFQQAGLHILQQQPAVSGHVLITVGRKESVTEGNEVQA